MFVITAEHHCAKLCHKRFGTSGGGNNLRSSECAVVNRQIAQVTLWTNASHGVCNSVKYLLLRQGTIIGDVVDITGSLLVISRQQKTLDDVGHIAERQRVVPPPDNHTLAVLHFLGHTPKVQSITGSKKGTWAQDNGLYIAGKKKAPQQTNALDHDDTDRVGIWYET